MALSFNGTSERIVYSIPPVKAAPCSLAAWFYPTSIANGAALIEVDDGTGNNAFDLGFRNTGGGNTVYAATAASTADFAESTTAVVANSWQHAAGVFTSPALRTAYRNGGSSGTNATSLTPVGINSGRIGYSNWVAFWMAGRIAEAAVWSRALSATEVKLLALGFAPSWFPSGLVFYAPLIQNGIPRPGNIAPIATGTKPAAHPPMICPPPILLARDLALLPQAVASARTRLAVIGCGV